MSCVQQLVKCIRPRLGNALVSASKRNFLPIRLNKEAFHTTRHDGLLQLTVTMKRKIQPQLPFTFGIAKQNNNIYSPLFNNSVRSYSQTDGDKDLINFLKEEISYEEKNAMEVPQFRDFRLQMDSTMITLSREVGGEIVEVCFDVNDNVNVDEELNAEQVDEEDMNMPDIVSYPQFYVKITKSSGLTLHFSCTCNTGLAEDEGEETQTDEDEQFELFRFDNVKICDENTPIEKAYEAETDTMDGELYSMLMTTLLERGVNGVFINDLIDLSTTVEHKHYLAFLKSLQSFATTK